MGCNCKNKNNSPAPEQPKAEPASVAAQTPQTQSVEFRSEEIKKSNPVKEKLTMMQSFATAIASRGFNNEKVTIPMKQLRTVSCFGNKAQGGILPPCEHLKRSETPGKFFCGGCGCGDRKGTWLVGDGDEYSKLDYPRLSCPLQMPGFSNYQKSKPDEAQNPVTRRWYIEQLPYKEIEKVSVTTHEPPGPTPEQTKPE